MAEFKCLTSKEVSYISCQPGKSAAQPAKSCFWRTHVFDFDDCADHRAGGQPAQVASQQGLGLLPDRRRRTDFDNPADPLSPRKIVDRSISIDVANGIFNAKVMRLNARARLAGH